MLSFQFPFSQHTDVVNHAVQIDPQGFKGSSLDQWPISSAADVCRRRRSEAGGTESSSTSLPNTQWNHINEFYFIFFLIFFLKSWFTLVGVNLLTLQLWLDSCYCKYFRLTLFLFTFLAGFLNSTVCCPSVPLSGKNIHHAIYYIIILDSQLSFSAFKSNNFTAEILTTVLK